MYVSSCRTTVNNTRLVVVVDIITLSLMMNPGNNRLDVGSFSSFMRHHILLEG